VDVCLDGWGGDRGVGYRDVLSMLEVYLQRLSMRGRRTVSQHTAIVRLDARLRGQKGEARQRRHVSRGRASRTL